VSPWKGSKTICWTAQQGTNRAYPELSVEFGSTVMLSLAIEWICQNTISDNLFRIQVLTGDCVPLDVQPKIWGYIMSTRSSVLAHSQQTLGNVMLVGFSMRGIIIVKNSCSMGQNYKIGELLCPIPWVQSEKIMLCICASKYWGLFLFKLTAPILSFLNLFQSNCTNFRPTAIISS